VRGELTCGRRYNRHPYLRDLCTAGEAAARIERFHERVEEFDGIPLQVLENTASAGDVTLMHPLLLHAPPTTHLGSRPRFLLNKDIICKGVSGRAILPRRQAARRTASSCLSQT